MAGQPATIVCVLQQPEERCGMGEGGVLMLLALVVGLLIYVSWVLKDKG